MAESAAVRKKAKYRQIFEDCQVLPFTVETIAMEPYSNQGKAFIKDLGILDIFFLESNWWKWQGYKMEL